MKLALLVLLAGAAAAEERYFVAGAGSYNRPGLALSGIFAAQLKDAFYSYSSIDLTGPQNVRTGIAWNFVQSGPWKLFALGDTSVSVSPQGALGGVVTYRIRQSAWHAIASIRATDRTFKLGIGRAF